MNNRISRVKLNRWLNIRKTTLSVLNNLLKSHINFHLTLENLNQLDNHQDWKTIKVDNKKKVVEKVNLFDDKLIAYKLR